MQHLHSGLVDTVSCIIVSLLCVVLSLRSRQNHLYEINLFWLVYKNIHNSWKCTCCSAHISILGTSYICDVSCMISYHIQGHSWVILIVLHVTVTCSRWMRFRITYSVNNENNISTPQIFPQVFSTALSCVANDFYFSLALTNQTGYRWLSNGTTKCGVLFNHEPKEQLQFSLSYCTSFWKSPFFQNIFPHFVFWWWRWRTFSTQDVTWYKNIILILTDNVLWTNCIFLLHLICLHTSEIELTLSSDSSICINLLRNYW